MALNKFLNTTLLTYNQAAALLNISPGTLRRWVMQKKIPYIKLLNRSVRFEAKELERWVKQQTRTQEVRNDN